MKQWQSSVVCPSLSLSFPLFVIPSRSTAVVSLHSTASSTCLFTYSLSSSPINSPPPHTASLPLSLDNSLHPQSASINPFCLFVHSQSSLFLLFFFVYLYCSERQWEAIQKVILNSLHSQMMSKGEKQQSVQISGVFPAWKWVFVGIAVIRNRWLYANLCIIETIWRNIWSKFGQSQSRTLNNFADWVREDKKLQSPFVVKVVCYL